MFIRVVICIVICFDIWLDILCFSSDFIIRHENVYVSFSLHNLCRQIATFSIGNKGFILPTVNGVMS
jgi:hypothetical protein